jgi:hypothetical protein
VDGFESKPDLLTKDMISLMTSCSSTNASYANGWFVNLQGNWWHTGSLPGTSAMMARLNNEINWVILFNKRSEDPNYFPDLDQLMWTALGKIKTWPGHDLFSSIQTGIIDPIAEQLEIFPNPAVYSSTIAFKITQPSRVVIRIYNSLGNEITKTIETIYPPGQQEYVWDCKNISRGIYICKIQIDNSIAYKKIILE